MRGVQAKNGVELAPATSTNSLAVDHGVATSFVIERHVGEATIAEHAGQSLAVSISGDGFLGLALELGDLLVSEPHATFVANLQEVR